MEQATPGNEYVSISLTMSFTSEQQFMYQRTNLNIIYGGNLNVGDNAYCLSYLYLNMLFW